MAWYSFSRRSQSVSECRQFTNGPIKQRAAQASIGSGHADLIYNHRVFKLFFWAQTTSVPLFRLIIMQPQNRLSKRAGLGYLFRNLSQVGLIAPDENTPRKVKHMRQL